MMYPCVNVTDSRWLVEARRGIVAGLMGISQNFRWLTGISRATHRISRHIAGFSWVDGHIAGFSPVDGHIAELPLADGHIAGFSPVEVTQDRVM